jgi:hypothetical protein
VLNVDPVDPNGPRLQMTNRGISTEYSNVTASFMVDGPEDANGNSSMAGSMQKVSITQTQCRRVLSPMSSSNPFHARTLLFSSDSIDAKEVQFKTAYMTLSVYAMLNYIMIFHLFTVLYWIVAVYLVLINPFLGVVKSIRIFWVGQYCTYFQLIALFGCLSAWMYQEVDYIMAFLNMAHLRFFGLDYTAFSSIEDRNGRLSAYIGKFSNFYYRPLATPLVDRNSATFFDDLAKLDKKYALGFGLFEYVIEDPLILARQLPQLIALFLSTILSVATPASIKHMFVSMRLACTVCFGVQLFFRSTTTIFQFFMGDMKGAMEIISFIIALLVVPILFLDVILMKGQASNLKETSNFWTTPMNKGSLYFDILGYTGHKKYRDFYPFPLGELEVMFIMAIIICAFSFSPITQSIILVVLSLLGLVAVILLNQFKVMKLLKIVWHFLLFAFFVMVLIVALSPTVSVSVAKTLATILLILFFALLVLNMLILFYRLFDLMNDASSTYGEKAKPIPPLKVKPLTKAPASSIMLT